MPTKIHHTLVTGAGGAIGRVVCAELTSRGHEVIALDMIERSAITDPRGQSQLANVAAWHTAPITDADATRRAAAGVDTIVHLAGEPHSYSDFMTKILPANIIGVYNVFEAARLEGVKRVVFTSTCQVGTLHKGPFAPDPASRPLHPVRDGTNPTSMYGASKVFGEAVGQAYAQSHKINVFAVRVGWMPRSAEECEYFRTHPPSASWYLSPRDAGRFFAHAVEAPLTNENLFTVMFATSRVNPARFEIDTPKSVIGYEPLDQWPSGTEVYGFKP